MDSLPPDFSAPPTFIEHTVFTRDLTGWPKCWSFEQKMPFRQNTKVKSDKKSDQSHVNFGYISGFQSKDMLNFNIVKGKSYAYISSQSYNSSYRLAPMAFRPDDFPNYRVYFSGSFVISKDNSYPAYVYLDSDHVLLTYLPSGDKYNYPKISGNVSKSLKDDKRTIQSKIIPESENILAIQKDMFLGFTAWERIFPKFPIYYGEKLNGITFFERYDSQGIDSPKYPIVFDATNTNSLWVLTDKYMYFFSGFMTNGGFSFETRVGDTIRYENIDLRYMSPSDQWLLRWERAPEEKCREAFAPLVNSSVTPQEAKPIFFNE